jgi:G:T-mismatch repair DNA endonuclease (very short patch repair protein)
MDGTMERKNMLEEAGYKVECIWECGGEQNKNALENRAELEGAGTE